MTYETLDELIEELGELSKMGYGNLRVRVAHQPNWPLSERVCAVTVADHDGDGEMVWLASTPISSWSSESPYAPSCAWAGGVCGEDFDPDDY